MITLVRIEKNNINCTVEDRVGKVYMSENSGLYDIKERVGTLVARKIGESIGERLPKSGNYLLFKSEQPTIRTLSIIKEFIKGVNSYGKGFTQIVMEHGVMHGGCRGPRPRRV